MVRAMGPLFSLVTLFMVAAVALDLWGRGGVAYAWWALAALGLRLALGASLWRLDRQGRLPSPGRIPETLGVSISAAGLGAVVAVSLTWFVNWITGVWDWRAIGVDVIGPRGFDGFWQPTNPAGMIALVALIAYVAYVDEALLRRVAQPALMQRFGGFWGGLLAPFCLGVASLGLGPDIALLVVIGALPASLSAWWTGRSWVGVPARFYTVWSSLQLYAWLPPGVS